MFLPIDLIRLNHLLSLSVRRVDQNKDGSKRVPRLCSKSAFAVLLGMLLAASAPAHAQLKTTAHVEPAKGQAVLYTTSIGATGDRWDPKAFDPATIKLLQDIGITSLRFPGNNGIDALSLRREGTPAPITAA